MTISATYAKNLSATNDELEEENARLRAALQAVIELVPEDSAAYQVARDALAQ